MKLSLSSLFACSFILIFSTQVWASCVEPNISINTFEQNNSSDFTIEGSGVSATFHDGAIQEGSWVILPAGEIYSASQTVSTGEAVVELSPKSRFLLLGTTIKPNTAFRLQFLDDNSTLLDEMSKDTSNAISDTTQIFSYQLDPAAISKLRIIIDNGEQIELNTFTAKFASSGCYDVAATKNGSFPFLFSIFILLSVFIRRCYYQ